MALKIRLARGGAKKRPVYRVVVADSRAPRDGRFVEKIGYYAPLLERDHPQRVSIDADRARYWLGVGARPSERVARFLDAMEIWPLLERWRPEYLTARRAERAAAIKAKEAGSGDDATAGAAAAKADADA